MLLKPDGASRQRVLHCYGSDRAGGSCGPQFYGSDSGGSRENLWTSFLRVGRSTGAGLSSAGRTTHVVWDLHSYMAPRRGWHAGERRTVNWIQVSEHISLRLRSLSSPSTRRCLANGSASQPLKMLWQLDCVQLFLEPCREHIRSGSKSGTGRAEVFKCRQHGFPRIYKLSFKIC